MARPRKKRHLWIILAHARTEWANGCYDQSARDLAEIRLIVKNLD